MPTSNTTNSRSGMCYCEGSLRVTGTSPNRCLTCGGYIHFSFSSARRFKMVTIPKKPILLNENDYVFIEKYCKKNNIVEGHGHKNFLAYMVNEYKKYCLNSKNNEGKQCIKQ